MGAWERNGCLDKAEVEGLSAGSFMVCRCLSTEDLGGLPAALGRGAGRENEQGLEERVVGEGDQTITPLSSRLVVPEAWPLG